MQVKILVATLSFVATVAQAAPIIIVRPPVIMPRPAVVTYKPTPTVTAPKVAPAVEAPKKTGVAASTTNTVITPIPYPVVVSSPSHGCIEDRKKRKEC